ncbi:MAG: SDR family NAD(P)-dependent oxidoreductase [Anaerolineae bacterium]|nr:SDR family NAD(P)-dependent oxidoreductase [Anaerolineae bacterium]NUQ04656.1 SDR family NAD(P)-dependent oxidoreductase [Anaerolineae bacterium]
MTILITGGAGFIGSRLALRLLAQQEPIVILDNFNDYYDPAIKRANIAALGGQAAVIEGDTRDEAGIERLFQTYPIRRVAHLAAMAGMRYSMERGRLYAEVNTLATVGLLDAARRHGVDVFVLGSTSSVYGNTDRVPFVEEDAATTPLAPYPASKRAAELFAHSYHNLYGLNVNVLRFFNVYGPHGRPDMMPLKALDSILNGRTIQMYAGGALLRDWTYIDDIVDGVIAALDRPMGFQIYNLGFGSPLSFTDFIGIYEELTGRKAITEMVDAPLSEASITYCNNARAREHLGFAPKIDILEGLARTWAWYRQRYLEPSGG